MAISIKQLLTRARARITPPANFDPTVIARDANGKGVVSNDPNARTWCAWGAVFCELHATPGAQYADHRAVCSHIYKGMAELHLRTGGPSTLMEAATAGHTAALAAFDHLIEIAPD